MMLPLPILGQDEAPEHGLWRGPADLSGGGEFEAGALEAPSLVGRRDFLKLSGAVAALAAVSGCIGPPERSRRLVPYVDQPGGVVPSVPLFFATAYVHAGYAEGVLAESHEGRPMKLEGNPQHPASLGAASAWAQASILDLYDPARSCDVRFRGKTATWQAVLEAARQMRAAWAQTGGRGLAILTGTVTSPTLGGQIEALLTQYPNARLYRDEPAAPGLRRAALGGVEPVYRVDRASVVVLLDADPLLMEPGAVAYGRQFASRRRVRASSPAEARAATMSRVYAAEPSPSVSGAAADHRLAVAPERLVALAKALAAGVGAGGASVTLTDAEAAWARAAAADLRAAGAASLVAAGETAPPAVHAVLRRINAALGAEGQTVTYAPPPDALPSPAGDPGSALAALTREMAAGRVETLLMLGVNPAYSAPADVPFAEVLARVETSIHLGRHVDETAWRSVWHVPETHPLEAWSDARAYDSTAGIVQPILAPLYSAAHSALDLVEALRSSADTPGQDLVRAQWARLDDAAWLRALSEGVVGGALDEAPAPGLSAPATSAPATSAPATSAPIESSPTPFTLDLRPDAAVYDGRHATNGWLQELPRPLTKIVWGNAALIAPADALRLGLIESLETLRWAHQTVDAPVLRLTWRGQSVEAPAFVQPGQAPGVVTLTLGYGRERAGDVGTGVGVSAYRLRRSDAPWGGPGLELAVTGKTHPVVTTQGHQRMEGRAPVRRATLDRFHADPAFPTVGEPADLPSLFEPYVYDGYKWGMSIDPTTCIGCNACVVACEAENNSPVVGRDQVRREREMHWLRVDRYWVGPAEAPAVVFQPVMCQHCEHAPCEVVCPVAATVHDGEGLNVMVYNRCIGTRYCSNNCPYKVRRFNFLQYTDWGKSPTLELMRNPEVTVRTRGVMEKCTYCVQRIARARITAQAEGRRIADGEVVTACQATCPTQAITFGDLNDPKAGVVALHAQPHAYGLLAELGTRPRTQYLGHVSNPSPALAGPATPRDATPTDETVTPA